MQLRFGILVLFILFVIVVNTAHAQTTTDGITASLNKPSYQPGDKVIISGSVSKIVSGNPVTIIVRNPIGNVYEVGQVTLSNNLFVHDFVLTDDASAGSYDAQIKHGNQTGHLSFIVNGIQVQSINVGDFFIKIRSNNTSLIIYKDVSVSTVDKSITISINTNATSTSTVLQEFQVPKKIIDAPGSSLIVQIDGTSLQCGQSETASDRILDCEIPSNAKELKLIGTVIIPEFGSITISILSIGILSTVFLRYKIKFM